jgi:large subunit ribosomal protein L15
VKILGDGVLNLKLEVKAHAFSKRAKEVIENLQGTIEIL